MYIALILAFFLLFFLKKVIRDFYEKGWEEWIRKYSKTKKK